MRLDALQLGRQADTVARLRPLRGLGGAAFAALMGELGQRAHSDTQAPARSAPQDQHQGDEAEAPRADSGVEVDAGTTGQDRASPLALDTLAELAQRAALKVATVSVSRAAEGPELSTAGAGLGLGARAEPTMVAGSQGSVDVDPTLPTAELARLVAERVEQMARSQLPQVAAAARLVSFDLVDDTLGLIQVTVRQQGEHTTVGLVASPAVAEQLRQASGLLRQRLGSKADVLVAARSTRVARESRRQERR